MNKVILIGNLTKTPTIETTNSGKNFSRFSIAVKRKNKDANGNEITDFFNVVCWNKTAELVTKYLQKGSKCLVEGELQTSTYQTQSGEKRYVTDVVVSSVEFLSKNEQQSKEVDDTASSVAKQPIDDDNLPF